MGIVFGKKLDLNEWKNPLEEGMVAHFHILAWRTP